jgi:hypothetical protein
LEPVAAREGEVEPAKAVEGNDLMAGFFCQASVSYHGLQLEKNSFLNERTGNVHENKGPLWKTCERSGNVHENKGT